VQRSRDLIRQSRQFLALQLQAVQLAVSAPRSAVQPDSHRIASPHLTPRCMQAACRRSVTSNLGCMHIIRHKHGHPLRAPRPPVFPPARSASASRAAAMKDIHGHPVHSSFLITRHSDAGKLAAIELPSTSTCSVE
jgi:hypothetical protein